MSFELDIQCWGLQEPRDGLDKRDESILTDDGERISRVIHNIVNNAIKFTEEGTITVTTKRAKDSDEVTVSVTDTGRGIDLAYTSETLLRFVAKSGSGTGLGLYLSKSIVEAHGGKIRAENNARGKGATVSFNLPMTQKKRQALLVK